MPLQTVQRLTRMWSLTLPKAMIHMIATKKGLWILNQLEHCTADQLDSADYTSLLKVDDRIYATTYDRYLSFYKGNI